VDDALDRVNGGIRTIEDRARAFLLHVSSKPPRWYHGPDEPAFEDEDESTDEPAA
jgi:hypothetical protein